MTDKELLDRIKARCVEDGGCLVWPGAMAAGRSPQIRDSGRLVSVRRFLWEQAEGRPVPVGMVIGVRCECHRCVRHIGPMTTAEVSRKVAATGALSAAVLGPKIAAGCRKRRKYDDATIAALRASGLAPMDLARQFGMNASYLYRVLKGEARRHDAPNPFAGLLAANDGRKRVA